MNSLRKYSIDLSKLMSNQFLTHCGYTWHTRFLKYGIICDSIIIDKACANL